MSPPSPELHDATHRGQVLVAERVDVGQSKSQAIAYRDQVTNL